METEGRTRVGMISHFRPSDMAWKCLESVYNYLGISSRCENAQKVIPRLFPPSILPNAPSNAIEPSPKPQPHSASEIEPIMNIDQ